MAPRNGPKGPYPYPTSTDWSEKLFEAIVNTCEDEGLVPLPEAAVKHGLAPALGVGEAKRIVETQRSGRRVLRQSAYHVEGRGTPQAMLCLNVDLYGAGSVPWWLNDRTRTGWVRSTPEAVDLQAKLVSAEISLARAEAALRRAKAATRKTGSTAARVEKEAAQAALKDAEQHLKVAEEQHKKAEAALNGRRPLPRIETHRDDGRPTAALATELLPVEVAASIQQYATAMLRKRGQMRPYDLEESLVQEGQRDRATVVLQLFRMTGLDGEAIEAWRPVRVTGNNRADSCLEIYGLQAHQIITGVPQPLLLLDGEKEDPALILRGHGAILRRLSARLNAQYANPDRHADETAERAKKIAQVPVRVVVGAAVPERLEASLRELNVHDHLRGQLAFVDTERSLALWSSIVKAYQDNDLLADLLLNQAAQEGSAPDIVLDTVALADALLGSGPLEPLAALLPATEPVTPHALRDAAIRCITAMMFPLVPPRPAGQRAGAHRRTGRYWPTVREALMEAPWGTGNGDSGQKVRRRTEVWATAVAQQFVHRGNLLAATGVFEGIDVQEGVRLDRRSLAELLSACENGDKQAWSALVRRHLFAGLINAPEPFITAGQGSEIAPNRKGVRRTPSNAIAALTRAYDKPDHPQVTRQLLLSFARSILHTPDSTEGFPGCPAGTFPAPDANGMPRPGVLADKEWFDDLFPKLPRENTHDQGQEEELESEQSPQEEGPKGDEDDLEPPAYTRDQYESQSARAARLRLELIDHLRATRAAFETAAEQAASLKSLAEDAGRARVLAGAEPAAPEIVMIHLQDIRAILAIAEELSVPLTESVKAVIDL